MKMQELKLKGQPAMAVAKIDQPCPQRAIEVRLDGNAGASQIFTYCIRELIIFIQLLVRNNLVQDVRLCEDIELGVF